MTDIHLRKLKEGTEQYIETYGRENKILKKNRSVNTQKTVERIIEEHREFMENRVWEAVKGTPKNPSLIEKSLKARKFATLLDPEKKIVACQKDWTGKRGNLKKIPLDVCDNCFERNPACPCKQNSYTQTVSKSPTPLKSTRYNGDGSLVPDSPIFSNEIACPMLDGQIIHIVKCDVCKAKAWDTWRKCKEGRLKISQ